MGEAGKDGTGFETSSPPALKNCSGSSEKRAASLTAAAEAAAAAAAAESRPGPRDPGAGVPAARC